MDTQYSFKVGKKYRVAYASSPDEYLQIALQAEKYIASAQITEADGIYWKLPETENTDNDLNLLMNRMGLYGGSSGILYFYLKLYQITKEERFCDIVKKAVTYICAHLSEAFPKEIRTMTQFRERVSLDIGILGISGIGFVLAEVYECYHWSFVESALQSIYRFYLAHRTTNKEGSYWTGSTTMITDTGVILFLLKYEKLFPSEGICKLINLAGVWFLSQQIKMSDGSVRFAGLECIWEGIKPNFEVGTAGSGFLLARLYEFTKERSYLDAAEKCADFLHNCKIPQSKGSLIPFRLDQDAGLLFYLGTCSGPAGTCRFFYLLYRLTGNRKYLEEIYDLIAGIESLGAPEQQSAGLWNNVNFCCGHAGLLQFFIALYQSDKDEHIRKLAKRTANVILGERDEASEGGVRWHIALERVNPDVISEPIGYYMGAAGIAASLLQMYISETNNFYWKRFIDDPFTEGNNNLEKEII